MTITPGDWIRLEKMVHKTVREALMVDKPQRIVYYRVYHTDARPEEVKISGNAGDAKSDELSGITTLGWIVHNRTTKVSYLEGV